MENRLNALIAKIEEFIVVGQSVPPPPVTEAEQAAFRKIAVAAIASGTITSDEGHQTVELLVKWGAGTATPVEVVALTRFLAELGDNLSFMESVPGRWTAQVLTLCSAISAQATPDELQYWLTGLISMLQHAVMKKLVTLPLEDPSIAEMCLERMKWTVTREDRELKLAFGRKILAIDWLPVLEILKVIRLAPELTSEAWPKFMAKRPGVNELMFALDLWPPRTANLAWEELKHRSLTQWQWRRLMRNYPQFRDQARRHLRSLRHPT